MGLDMEPILMDVCVWMYPRKLVHAIPRLVFGVESKIQGSSQVVIFRTLNLKHQRLGFTSQSHRNISHQRSGFYP